MACISYRLHAAEGAHGPAGALRRGDVTLLDHAPQVDFPRRTRVEAMLRHATAAFVASEPDREAFDLAGWDELRLLDRSIVTVRLAHDDASDIAEHERRRDRGRIEREPSHDRSEAGTARRILLLCRWRRRQTGRQKGLRDGQLVWVENEKGRKVKGRIRLTQGIHPEGLGIGTCAGHWSDGMPVAKGKGVFFNELLEIDWEHCSPVNLNLDLCVRVKVTPAEPQPASSN